MKDEEIVELYWQRSEDAIKETSVKYQAYLSKIAYNILIVVENCSSLHSSMIWIDSYLKRK